MCDLPTALRCVGVEHCGVVLQRVQGPPTVEHCVGVEHRGVVMQLPSTSSNPQ